MKKYLSFIESILLAGYVVQFGCKLSAGDDKGYSAEEKNKTRFSFGRPLGYI
jgi:hypothetical protein